MSEKTMNPVSFEEIPAEVLENLDDSANSSEDIVLPMFSLKENKKEVSKELKNYKACAKALKKRKAELDKAEAAFEKHPEKTKLANRFDAASEAFDDALLNFSETGEIINAYLMNIGDQYEELCENAPKTKTARKLQTEGDNYFDKVADSTAKIDDTYISNLGLIFEEEDPEDMLLQDTLVNNDEIETVAKAEEPAAPVKESAPTVDVPTYYTDPYAAYRYSYPCQPPMYAPYPPAYDPAVRPAVKIAPVSVDVSDIVERAVAATMEKFTAVFEKRFAAYAADLPAAAPVTENTTVVQQVVSSSQVELVGEVAENEKTALEKLTACRDELSLNF